MVLPERKVKDLLPMEGIGNGYAALEADFVAAGFFAVAAGVGCTFSREHRGGEVLRLRAEGPVPSPGG